MTTEDPMVIWERKKAIKAAERAVIAAAEKWAGKVEAPIPWDFGVLKGLDIALFDAVSALREARGE